MADKVAKIKEVFQRYDRDGNGTLSADELRDLNGDGAIQFEEFVNWVSTPAAARTETRAKAALAPASSDQGLSAVFFRFCGAGCSDMDGKGFAKLCKDCGLVDRKLSTIEVDLIFTKVLPKGKRRIELPQFEAALNLVADKKGVSVEDVTEVLLDAGGPRLVGTNAEAVRFYDDKSTYTGAAAAQAASASSLSGLARVPTRSASPCVFRQAAPHILQRERPSYASYQDLFRAYCGGQADMDGRSFARLCRDCHIIDPSFSVSDADVVFASALGRGQRRIGLRQFEDALFAVSERKGVAYADFLDAVTQAGSLSQTTSMADFPRFQADRSTCSLSSACLKGVKA